MRVSKKLRERLEEYMKYRTGDCRNCPLRRLKQCDFLGRSYIIGERCREMQIEFILEGKVHDGTDSK